MRLQACTDPMGMIKNRIDELEKNNKRVTALTLGKNAVYILQKQLGWSLTTQHLNLVNINDPVGILFGVNVFLHPSWDTEVVVIYEDKT